MKSLFITLIQLYRLCLGPFIGNVCRFYPSCSEYTQEAIEKHGIFKGTWLGMKRIGKCNPWNLGGYDPVPEKDPNPE